MGDDPRRPQGAWQPHTDGRGEYGGERGPHPGNAGPFEGDERGAADEQKRVAIRRRLSLSGPPAAGVAGRSLTSDALGGGATSGSADVEDAALREDDDDQDDERCGDGSGGGGGGGGGASNEGADAKADAKEARKQRNRESAHRSRIRRNAMLDEMQLSLKHLMKENALLRRQLAACTHDPRHLVPEGAGGVMHGMDGGGGGHPGALVGGYHGAPPALGGGGGGLHPAVNGGRPPSPLRARGRRSRLLPSPLTDAEKAEGAPPYRRQPRPYG